MPEPIHLTLPTCRARDLAGLARDADGVPYERVRRRGVDIVVHYDDLPPEDLAVVRGIPCTSAVRTVIDVAADVDQEQLERILDDALGRELLTLDDLRLRLAKPDLEHRRGAIRLRSMLVARREGSSE